MAKLHILFKLANVFRIFRSSGAVGRKDYHSLVDVLSKLAQMLNTSVDYIILGNAHEKATAALNDRCQTDKLL